MTGTANVRDRTFNTVNASIGRIPYNSYVKHTIVKQWVIFLPLDAKSLKFVRYS